MSRATKDEARLAIESYGMLLQEHAVITEIITEEVRGELEYKIQLAGKTPYEVVARGCKEAALVISSMWMAYELAYDYLYN